MEKTTKEFKDLQLKLESCFKELNYKYSLVDMNDGDINFNVYLDASEKIKFLESIPVLIYANFKDDSIRLLVINIYSFDKGEDITPFYKIVNDINNFLPHGKFSIKEEIRQIIYSSSINCGNNFSNLSVDKIKTLENCFLENLVRLLTLIPKRSK